MSRWRRTKQAPDRCRAGAPPFQGGGLTGQCVDAVRRAAPYERAAFRFQSFTLIELIVVISIIGILTALVVPGAAGLWSQRNEAASANMIRGLLQSVRTQAIRFGERGLFFYVDRDGVQRIAFIESDPSRGGTTPRDQFDCSAASQPLNCVTEAGAVNRFHVMNNKVYTVPTPFRIAPSWALTPVSPPGPVPFPLNPSSSSAWPQQLQNQRFPIDTRGPDTPQYHRNFFTIVFDSAGQLIVGRPMLIHDTDADDNGIGDRSRLGVFDVVRWWDNAGVRQDVDGRLFDIVMLDDTHAANFTSVDGLVVYDDSEVEGLAGGSIQSVMLSDGQSLYVSRYTGEVIFGPKGG
ncbi:MAG: prepilin-type N-terminal cleavage/methylation domain-containing protein [Planctomycetes bacterium]|nr:prepilin-type N-terminal cleavage/methylation domain-containing protein [Planctomycetota bacterium]